MCVDPDQTLLDESAGDVAGGHAAKLGRAELHDGYALFIHVGLQVAPDLLCFVQTGLRGDRREIALDALVVAPACPGHRRRVRS